MQEWCAGWADVVTVRWERVDPVPGQKGEDGSLLEHFEPLHENCLRTQTFPSKAYGNAGCTSKWKVQPMERWRKAHGFDHGAFAVGYDAGEDRRIMRACQRGDDPHMVAWYPLVAWGIDRMGCEQVCREEGLACIKSSCFMCPNMKEDEWSELRSDHPELFDLALEIERKARAAGESPQAGIERLTAGFLFDPEIRAQVLAKFAVPGQESLLDQLMDDRCHHGGCFT